MVNSPAVGIFKRIFKRLKVIQEFFETVSLAYYVMPTDHSILSWVHNYK